MSFFYFLKKALYNKVFCPFEKEKNIRPQAFLLKDKLYFISQKLHWTSVTLDTFIRFN